MANVRIATTVPKFYVLLRYSNVAVVAANINVT